MVDSSPVVGHDALQRPSRPQAKRHSRDRQHDVRQVDEIKNDRRRVMLILGITILAQHTLDTPETLADIPIDFFLPAPASNCNGRLRKELRHDIGFAIHSARSFLPSATAALGRLRRVERARK